MIGSGYMEELYIELKDTLGNIKKYEVLHTFTNNDKSYVIYTDNIYDKDNLNIYASTYHMFKDKIVLDSIDNDFNYKLVEEEIKKFINGD